MSDPAYNISPIPIFNENLKSAYSHGLENIYLNFESINIDSIRPLTKAVKVLEKEPKQEFALDCMDEGQLELDLGDSFRSGMEPFLLSEPIQVLELSKNAEKCLLENGKRTIKDLVHTKQSDFVFFKGMGQGHIDEVEEKLKEYLAGKVTGFSKRIDFISWLRSYMGDIEKKQAVALLEKHQLFGICTLSPAESAEVKRAGPERKLEWEKGALAGLLSPEKRMLLEKHIRQVCEIFIKPWLLVRNGFATYFELMERVQRISVQEDLALSVLKFFQEIFFGGKFPFGNYLFEVEEKLYFANPEVAANYSYVIEKAQSYFYKKSLVYSLSEIVGWLLRDFGRSWLSYDETFIEKVLRYSKMYRVIKDRSGVLVVKLR